MIKTYDTPEQIAAKIIKTAVDDQDIEWIRVDNESEYYRDPDKTVRWVERPRAIARLFGARPVERERNFWGKMIRWKFKDGREYFAVTNHNVEGGEQNNFACIGEAVEIIKKSKDAPNT